MIHIFLGMTLTLIGIMVMVIGITNELQQRITVVEGSSYVTTTNGVTLKASLLTGATDQDGNPVKVITYVEEKHAPAE